MKIQRAGAASVIHNNRIYMLGGVDGKVFLNSVEYAEIKDDGSLTSWKFATPLPQERGFFSAIVFQNKIFVVGGANGKYGENLLRTVFSAKIQSDGSLSQWMAEKSQLLIPRRCSKLILKDNKLLAIGGFGGALLDTVEAAIFDKQGQLGSWRMLPNKLTIPRYVNGVSEISNEALVIAGHHPTKGIGISEVEYANFDDLPLRWKQSSQLNQGRYAFATTQVSNVVYVLGGISGSEYLASVERLKVEKSVSESDWTYTTDLPLVLSNFHAKVINDKIYILGGSTGKQYLNKVWFAEINKSGDLGFWGSQKQYSNYTLNKTQSKSTENLPNSGKVMDVINTEGYTYVQVKQHNESIWIATTNIEAKIGDKISFSQGVSMPNFYSKALMREFNVILFVGEAKVNIPN